MAHAVSERTQQIGIRMAVDATGNNIHRLVFGQACANWQSAWQLG
jgi:ABC-type antimicrobial peptide transport system permease subunit